MPRCDPSNKDLKKTLIEGELVSQGLAHRHYENFNIAAFFLPKRLKQDIYNIYAFLRLADDIADECEDDLEADRVLEEWMNSLETKQVKDSSNPVINSLLNTLECREIPPEPFQKLITAFRMDLTKKRWETWDNLRDYTMHSADPVGHIILHLFGYRNPDFFALSDKICTALQLTNHWQDVREDWERGRIYIPQEDLQHFDVSETEIGQRSATDRFKELMTFEVKRARSLFLEGFPLLGKVSAGLRIQLALYWYGGMRALDAIERIDYDVLNKSAKLGFADKMVVTLKSFSRLIWLTG